MKSPYLLILLIVIGLVLVAALVVLFVYLAKRKKASIKPIASRSEYFEALGGEENFVSAERSGSRIVVILRNYSLIDKEKIKEAGVTGFIEKSDKLTLVVKDNAEEVYEKIFNV
ncbi:MAG: hypothetical protein MJ228_03770 [Bacilli bacterium]|nr:hypothetical protein [Bacilli bacterium]